MVEKVNNTFKPWNKPITKIAGLGSRGFIYGPLLTAHLSAGFVMVQKAGKLPGKTFQVEYTTEYSKDKFEILQNAITKDDTVLIVDDLVATGGSLDAAKQLIQMAGGTVVGCFTVLKVDPLFKKAQYLLKDTPIVTLLGSKL